MSSKGKNHVFREPVVGVFFHQLRDLLLSADTFGQEVGPPLTTIPLFFPVVQHGFNQRPDLLHDGVGRVRGERRDAEAADVTGPHRLGDTATNLRVVGGGDGALFEVDLDVARLRLVTLDVAVELGGGLYLDAGRLRHGGAPFWSVPLWRCGSVRCCCQHTRGPVGCLPRGREFSVGCRERGQSLRGRSPSGYGSSPSGYGSSPSVCGRSPSGSVRAFAEWLRLGIYEKCPGKTPGLVGWSVTADDGG